MGEWLGKKGVGLTAVLFALGALAAGEALALTVPEAHPGERVPGKEAHDRFLKMREENRKKAMLYNERAEWDRIKKVVEEARVKCDQISERGERADCHETLDEEVQKGMTSVQQKYRDFYKGLYKQDASILEWGHKQGMAWAREDGDKTRERELRDSLSSELSRERKEYLARDGHLARQHREDRAQFNSQERDDAAFRERINEQVRDYQRQRAREQDRYQKQVDKARDRCEKFKRDDRREACHEAVDAWEEAYSAQRRARDKNFSDGIKRQRKAFDAGEDREDEAHRRRQQREDEAAGGTTSW